ncbi:cyclin-like protein, partial [Piptocephalis cylindrospora]
SLPPVPQPPYTQHTQHNNWRFSQEQLLKRRQDNLRASLARLASTPEQEVTLEDQLDLCSFYEGRLVTLARALKYSDAVLGTAIAFFRRFYLKHSILDHSPATLIFPCLYLSLKAEDNFIPMDQFVTKVKKSLSDGEAILAMEFCLSSSLGFQFAIRHPYRPLYGFFLNAQRHCKDRPILRRIHKEAKARVRTALLTDAPLIYSPSQIALAVLSHTIYQQGTPDLKSKYL